MSEQQAAVLSGVSVCYGAVTALRGFDMEIPPRGVHGLLGRNGAGKTTAIRALAGLLRLSGGVVRVLGADPAETRGRISVLFSEDGLVPSLTVAENLAIWCGFYGFSRSESIDMTRNSLKAFGMQASADKPVKDLSTGNRRAVAMARVFAVPSELVILDEPTASLDPVKAAEVRGMIAEAAGSRPVLLSTHNLAEAQTVCDTITIVHRGERVLSGELKALMSASGFLVRTVEGSVVHRGTTSPPDSTGRVHLESDLHPDMLLEALIREGNRVTEFRAAGRNLDEIFLNLSLEDQE